jgi:N-acetylglutamate synthase-like GNAT family acetyltransferase
MSTVKYSILPVEKSDISFLGNFLYTCKLALPINRLLFKHWPNGEAQKEIYTGAIRSGHEDPNLEDFKVINEEGGVVGYLALSRKRPVQKSEKREEEGGKDDGEEGVFVEDVLKSVMEAVGEIGKSIEGVDHYGTYGPTFALAWWLLMETEITYITVSPFYRRQGIGSQLINIGLERAKREGLPLFVCSEPEAHAFFLAQGLKDNKHFDIDLAQWAAPESGFGLFRLSGMRSEP